MNTKHFLSAAFLSAGLLLSSMHSNAQSQRYEDRDQNREDIRYQNRDNDRINDQDNYRHDDKRYDRNNSRHHNQYRRNGNRHRAYAPPIVVRRPMPCYPAPRRIVRRMPICAPIAVCLPSPRRHSHHHRGR